MLKIQQVNILFRGCRHIWYQGRGGENMMMIGCDETYLIDIQHISPRSRCQGVLVWISIKLWVARCVYVRQCVDNFSYLPHLSEPWPLYSALGGVSVNYCWWINKIQHLTLLFIFIWRQIQKAKPEQHIRFVNIYDDLNVFQKCEINRFCHPNKISLHCDDGGQDTGGQMRALVDHVFPEVCS